MKHSLWLLISLAALAFKPVAADVIYVSGNVSGTWSADTVIVTAEVNIPAGQSLTISPGVEVLFQANCKFIVNSNAVLTAVGTVTDSIRFDALQDTAHWGSIRFLSASDNSTLQYCILKNSRVVSSTAEGGAIYCNNSSPLISHNTISGNSATGSQQGGGYGGGIWCGNSSPSIISNTISDNSVFNDFFAHCDGGGIYLVGGNPTISNNTISGNSATGSGGGGFGGGIYCMDSFNPTISYNTIQNNSAYYGGAIYCSSSNPMINNNTISGNSVTAFNDESDCHGGGICCFNSSPAISNNTISSNSTTGYGFGTSAGGGIYCLGGSLSISNNTISNNSAANYYYILGGGIYCQGGSTVIIFNTISNNSTSESGGGGGIFCMGGSPMIIDNTISDNSTSYGGGICIGESGGYNIIGNIISSNSAGEGGGLWVNTPGNITINKNTIIGNTAPITGGLKFNGSGVSTIVNSIIWLNSSQQITGSGVQVTYSDIQGGWSGTGNINQYPMFVDTTQHDYRLQLGSPCIDTGDPNPYYNDPDGSRADMGCYYYGWVGVKDPEAQEPPHEFALLGCYPNPFNPSTTLTFALPEAGNVHLTIYDVSGRQVAELVNGYKDAGSHQATFNGSNLSSGIYFVRLESANQSALQKILLLK